MMPSCPANRLLPLTGQRIVMLLVVLVCGLVGIRSTVHSARHAAVGVLVLAHGGSDAWNQHVREAVAQAQLEYPTEVAFGMGMHAHEAAGMQEAVARLAQHDLDRLIVIPLLISSASAVMRQYEYLVGLRADGSWDEVSPLVLPPLSVVMAGALDDDPIVGDILLERARALSEVPAQESVALIAHGPTTDEDNAQWVRIMEALAEQMRRAAGFHAVVAVTMRDDASESVLEQATRAMREQISQLSRESRVLVVPLLLARGGVEHKIPERLAGLEYAYEGKTLLPHPALSGWIAQQVRRTTQPLGGQREASYESPVAERPIL